MPDKIGATGKISASGETEGGSVEYSEGWNTSEAGHGTQRDGSISQEIDRRAWGNLGVYTEESSFPSGSESSIGLNLGWGGNRWLSMDRWQSRRDRRGFVLNTELGFDRSLSVEDGEKSSSLFISHRHNIEYRHNRDIRAQTQVTVQHNLRNEGSLRAVRVRPRLRWNGFVSVFNAAVSAETSVSVRRRIDKSANDYAFSFLPSIPLLSMPEDGVELTLIGGYNVACDKDLNCIHGGSLGLSLKLKNLVEMRLLGLVNPESGSGWMIGDTR